MNWLPIIEFITAMTMFFFGTLVVWRFVKCPHLPVWEVAMFAACAGYLVVN